VTAGLFYAAARSCASQRPEPPAVCCNVNSARYPTGSTDGTTGNKFAGAKPSVALATYLPRLVYRQSAGLL
jgi:hypothetical protein